MCNGWSRLGRSRSRCYYPPRMRWRRRVALAAIAVRGRRPRGQATSRAHDYVRGAAFVVRAAGMHGVVRSAAPTGKHGPSQKRRSRFRGVRRAAGSPILAVRSSRPRLPARPRRPRLGHRRAAARRLRARSRVDGPSRRHRRSRPDLARYRSSPARHRRDRGRGRVARRSSGPRRPTGASG